MCSVAFADPPDFVYIRPNFPTNKVLNAQEQSEVKKTLHTGRNLIMMELTPAKNNYMNDFDRGTVHYNPRVGYNSWLKEEVLEARNYSHHKVIIPNDTTIKGVNFSRKNSHTNSIQGKNLTFIDCNLNNVEIDPTWTIIGGLHIHSRHRIIEEDGKTYDIYEVEKDGKFEEVKRTDITNTM